MCFNVLGENVCVALARDSVGLRRTASCATAFNLALRASSRSRARVKVPSVTLCS